MKKPLIGLVSESNSDNLGDKAIASSLASILLTFYSVTEVSFSTIPVSHAEYLRTIVIPLTLLQIIRRIVPSKIFALFGWHILGDKSRFKRYFEAALLDCDLVIIGGGQLIKDNVDLFCQKLVLASDICASRLLPYALMGVGVDGRTNLSTLGLLRKTITAADPLIFRDNISKKKISNAKMPIDDSCVLPDFAFALSNPYFKPINAARNISLAINIMNVQVLHDACSGSRRVDPHSILEGYLAIIEAASNDKSCISLFTSGSAEDLATASIVAQSAHHRFGLDVPIFHPLTLDELLFYLVSVNDVIATRMHAGILAYISGCNVICVNWDEKVEGVWSVIGQEKRVVEIHELVRASLSVTIVNKLLKLDPPSPQELENLYTNTKAQILFLIEKVLPRDQIEASQQAYGL